MSCVVSIHSTRGDCVGTGVIIAHDLVLTCAHVINIALSRKSEEHSRPAVNGRIVVRFAESPGEFRFATLEPKPDAWSAPPANRAEGADLCILKLEGALPAKADIAQLNPKRFREKFEADVSGYPEDWNKNPIQPQLSSATVTVKAPDGYLWLMQADLGSHLASTIAKKRVGGLIHSGFSGGPLHVGQTVVGIAAQAREDVKDATSYAIPAHYFPARILPPVADAAVRQAEASHTTEASVKGRGRRAPMMAPQPPPDFVQRLEEFGALKSMLRSANGKAIAITAALRGAGGYGKTTLAKALAHDPDIMAAYADGVLWAELGEKPTNLLSLLADLIEIINGERPGLENLNSAAAKLGEALGNRHILLVIDDAWREQDLRPFLQGGGCNTARLITTRRDDILPIGIARRPVDAMATDEALKLVLWGLPEDQTAALKQLLSALTQRLGRWALLLKLVNGFLRHRVLTLREPLHSAIVGVNKRLDAKGLTAFDAKNEAERANAIAKTFGLSLELLTDSERARFAELAVFPEDVDVPIGVVSRLWEETGGLGQVDTEDLLQHMQRLSLLLSLDFDERTFRLHDTVRHLLQEQAGKSRLAVLHKWLLKGLERTEEGPDESSRRYYYLYRPVHLAGASDLAALDALLLDPSWLQGKLTALHSPQALIADYEQFGSGEMQTLIGGTLRLITGICARDRFQLLPQLHGRLIGRSVAAPFCAEILKCIQRPAIITCIPSLAQFGPELARFEGHRGSVRALVRLHDWWLASGSADGTIRLWDAKTGVGHKLASLGPGEESPQSLAALPNGRLASGSDNGTIRLWDVKARRELAQFTGDGKSVSALTVLPDGRLVAGHPHGTMTLWDLKTGRPLMTLQGPDHLVTVLGVLADGRLVSGLTDASIRLWDVQTGEHLAQLRGHEDSVTALAVLPDGRLASASNDTTIRLWDTDRCIEAARLEGHTDFVQALAVLPDGRLASGSCDATIRFWDVPAGREVARIDNDLASEFAVLPEDRLASCSSVDFNIKVWDTKTCQLPQVEQRSKGPILYLAWLPDGRLVFGSGAGPLGLWDPATGRMISGHENSTHTGDEDWVTALAVLADGRLISCSSGGNVRLWDISANKDVAPLSSDKKSIMPLAARLTRKKGGINALAVLPDGRLVLGYDNGRIRLWDTSKNKVVGRLDQKEGVAALTVLPDGRLVSGSSNGIIMLWDVHARIGQELVRHEVGAVGLMRLAVLPDGRLISGAWDDIRIWDVKTGRELQRLEVTTDWVGALTVLPDGRIATAFFDSAIRIWDASSGKEIARLEMDVDVWSLAGTNKHLAAGDSRGRIHWLEIVD